MTSLACAIDDCAVDLQGIRFLEPAEEDGHVVNKPSQYVFAFRGSIQPMSGKELRNLAHGMRNDNRKKLYTTVELFTVQTSACKVPDRVVHKNITYQVDVVDDWQELGGYYRAELVRMDR